MKWLTLLPLLLVCGCQDKNKDNGFLNVCWKDGGSWYPCSSGKPIKWTLPIKVSVGEEEISWDVEEATIRWNDWLGCNVFKIVDKEADVLVGYVEPDDDDDTHLGSTGFFLRDGKQLASVIFYTKDHKALAIIAPHELGHILSLAHDGMETSIMYPTVDPEYPETYRTITLRDKLLLVELYNEKGDLSCPN